MSKVKEIYTVIAKQVGSIADGLMDEGLSMDAARHAVAIVASGFNGALSDRLMEALIDTEVNGEQFALMLYDIGSDCFKAAKGN